MRLSFANTEIAKWAEFSHDYNPIHFDAASAAKAGSSQIIVHGMLAVLPIKEKLGQLMDSDQDSATWYRFKSRFKKPVPMDCALAVDISEKSKSVGFMLKQSKAQITNIEGQILRLPEAPLVDADMRNVLDFTIKAGILQTRYREFKATYQDVSQTWIALDAIVFSEFLNTMLPGVLKKLKIGIEIPDGLASLTDVVVVQTAHTVEYEGALQIGDDELVCQVRCDEPLRVGNMETATVNISCFQGARHVMNVGIGLLMIMPGDT